MAAIVLVEMRAGKPPGIISESEARDLETRRHRDLLGEDETEVGILKVVSEEDNDFESLCQHLPFCAHTGHDPGG